MRLSRFEAGLEKIIESLGYQIRKERGNFKGDFCVLEGERVVMLNASFPREYHVGQMVRFLKHQDLEVVFIKPAVRKELERWFAKLNRES